MRIELDGKHTQRKGLKPSHVFAVSLFYCVVVPLLCHIIFLIYSQTKALLI